MTVAEPQATQLAARPEFFRLPKPGSGDPHFGFSRSFYYQLEQRGLLKLVRIRARNKSRGVTLIRFQDVLRVVQSQMEAQNGEAKW